MRKVILFNMLTLDGFFAGPKGELDWHRVDAEFNEFAVAQLYTAGGLIFGRVTYQMMASYWPSPAGVQDDPVVAGLMNSIPKLVASRTLAAVDWQNARLVSSDFSGEMLRLKQQPGGDLYIFGSATLAASLTQEHLIDEYRVILNPIVLGSGRPLFQQPLRLELITTRPFRNGNMLLIYRPEELGGQHG